MSNVKNIDNSENFDNEVLKNIDDSENFDNEVLKSNLPTLVDFWAPWCGPCKALSPTIEEIAKEMQGQLKVAKVNIDENQELAQKYGIRSIPTLMLFKDGQMVDTMLGSMSKTKLEDFVNTHLKS